VDEAVVVRHEQGLIQARVDAPANGFDDVGRVLGKDRLVGEQVLHVPVTARIQAGGVGIVEHVQDLAHDADVLSEACLVGRVAAPRVVEVPVEAEHHVDLVGRLPFRAATGRDGHGERQRERSLAEHAYLPGSVTQNRKFPMPAATGFARSS
jgi:hypothetical protein